MRGGYGRSGKGFDAEFAEFIATFREGSLGGERGLDSGDDAWVVGFEVGCEASEDGAVLADEELLEVPEEFGVGVGRREAVSGGVFGEALAPGSVADGVGSGGDELGVERVLVRAGDGDLGEEREGDGVGGGAEGGNLGVGAGLLSGEVVGREAEDGEACVLVRLVQGFERGVLRREAALARDVDDEQDAAGVVGEGCRGARDGGERDGREFGHGSSLARDGRIQSMQTYKLRRV